MTKSYNAVLVWVWRHPGASMVWVTYGLYYSIVFWAVLEINHVLWYNYQIPVICQIF